MMNSGFLALTILAAVHLFANQANVLGWLWHGRFLSFACGISFSYVFVDLLPTLEKGQPTLRRAFESVIPYFDRHVYLIALFGVLFYYGLHIFFRLDVKRNFWISISGYVLFNFFIGTSLSDNTNPDIQPLTLFTIAMGMHYFVCDHNACLNDRGLYQNDARWYLVIALFSGYFVGCFFRIPDAVVVLVVSFLAGGVFLNVLHYELPKGERVGYIFFVIGALLYTAILLTFGDV